MSKYTELREILKEDIELIVEQRLAERMESIINALMPAILEHVANSIKFNVYDTDTSGNNEIRTAHLTLQTSPIHSQYIGSVDMINPVHYQNERSHLLAAYQDITNRLNILERQNP